MRESSAPLDALHRTLQQAARGPAGPMDGADEALACDGLVAAAAALPPRMLVTRAALARLKAQVCAAAGGRGQEPAPSATRNAKPPAAPADT